MGKKLREARKTGFRFVVLFGKGCRDAGGAKVELHELGKEEGGDAVKVMAVEEVVGYLKGV